MSVFLAESCTAARNKASSKFQSVWCPNYFQYFYVEAAAYRVKKFDRKKVALRSSQPVGSLYR